MHNFAIERSVSYFKNQTNLSTFENDIKIIIYITLRVTLFFQGYKIFLSVCHEYATKNKR